MISFYFQVLEGLMNNLLHDIPLPSPGRSVRFWCLGEAISLSMPKVPQELPLFDYDLLQFFAILGVENAIKLWVCLLLENQILVYSSDFDKVYFYILTEFGDIIVLNNTLVIASVHLIYVLFFFKF